ncbi:MAG TPA: hypothetical protein VLK84_08410 [Longimicrobium sp.]|nr:hypothetical protein [Longimicrobium sp.]
MRKISLDVNELRVESFETVDGKSDERGTVHGYYTQFTCPRTQCGNQCPSGPNPCGGSQAWTDGVNACPCSIETLE